MPKRDIVVIGASAGGISALLELLGPLPLNVQASFFVVVHTSPDGGGTLPDILERGAALTASYARDGDAVQPSRIYVAPPDHHLLLQRDRIQLTRGPRENRFRPAIDPLFRTAAEVYAGRVIGIVLSGGLDDGTHGLDLIKRQGGLAIAQDPEDAIAPSMPLSAIQNVEVDLILKPAEIGARLTRLVSEEVDELITLGRKEPDVAEGTAENIHKVSGPPSEFTCPECGGTLWEVTDSRLLRYRCHVGHGYTGDSLLADQSDSVENALWGALRALEEHSMLRRRMAEHADTVGRTVSAREFEREAKRTEVRASTIRRLLRAERPVRVGVTEAAAAPGGDGGGRASARVKEPRPGTRTRRVNR